MDQISDILAKPWWQGVSVILTIIGLIIALVQLRKKKLGYLVQFSESVFEEDLGFTNQLSISYKDTVVKSLRVASVKIKNYGFLPIKSEDFHEAIEIKLVGNLRILDCEIKALNPKNLKVQFSIENKSIIINPTLLNSKDTFGVKVIYDGDNAEIDPSCRIVGVSRIKDLELVKQATKDLTVLTFFGVITLYTLLNWTFFVTPDNYGYQVLGCFVILGLLAYTSIYKDDMLANL
ncbi:hypothetical protein [Dyadobacter pollutisoli]|uniref:Uncharacterized protein n=1 Tax=Dyadobacter pollutisoli TaxID=2910158 RepID=A0A9E8NDV7_9BACT|nr:hypothetical protein [Dyadobacter pollutisoli]WAC14935.1 hypothetical protein ON006_13410 [Dyadobacter pollutisoli]